MRRLIVAGNWKMNGSRASVTDLLTGIRQGTGVLNTIDIIVFPSFVYLSQASEMLADSVVQLGAQTVSEHSAGAFTGEVAVSMLTDFGCQYVLVGHSERRALFAESSQTVAAKFATVQQAGLTPVLCVGESLQERERGQTEAVVAEQLDAILQQSGVAVFAQAVIAYEPVWAIGTGKTATPEQAQQVHAFIRSKIAELDAKIAGLVRILYGGSVKGSNATELFAMPDVDGGLIGGASLDASEFLTIAKAAANSN